MQACVYINAARGTVFPMTTGLEVVFVQLIVFVTVRVMVYVPGAVKV
jgi:hypothetical protein